LSFLLNAASDLLGLVGALLLAVPFVMGQPVHDAQLLAEDQTAAATAGVRRALAKAAATLRKHIRERAPIEYSYGMWGAFLVAASFLLKLIAVIDEALG
jgi:hypothetical protein